MFLSLPIVCETPPVSFCILSWSILTPWIYGVYFCGRILVRFIGAVSSISWAYLSWAVVSVGSVYVFGFWLLLGISLEGPSHQLVNWGSLCPPRLVFCCAGVWEETHKSQETKPHLQILLPPPQSHYQQQMNQCFKGVKRLRLL